MKHTQLLLYSKALFLFLLITLSSNQLQAQNNSNKQLIFNKKQLSLQLIVDKLRNGYGYKVSFDADVNMAKTVTLSSENVTFDQLTDILQQQIGVGIRNIDGNLVIKKLPIILVRGTVTSSDDQQPMAGVSIADNAKHFLGITDAKGTFAIQVAAGGIINFSLIGYETQKKTFNVSTSGAAVVLTPSNTSLNEVVVTALGIKREEKALGYAATVVKGEQLTEALSNNWTEALEGKVAGLNLVRSNSGPTGSNKIILRGENNLTGDNEALIVVDGVVINNGSGKRTGISGENVYGTGSDNMPADYGSSINDINPEDIESVTVLKGPGAAAL